MPTFASPDRRTLAGGLLAHVMLCFAAFAFGDERPERMAPCDVLVRSGPSGADELYVLAEDGRMLTRWDAATKQCAGRLSLPAAPHRMAWGPDRQRLAVVAGGAEGCVYLVDLDELRIEKTLDAGHTPSDVVVAPCGSRLFAVNRFDNDIWEIDVATGQRTRRWEATREPVAVDLSPDGKTLLVANHLSAERADRFFTAAVVDVVHLETGEMSTIRLPDGAMGVRDLAISPDGRLAAVSHVLANYQLVPAQVNGGWINTNAVSWIDVEKADRINTLMLDEGERGAGNPWAVAWTPDGDRLIVAHAGSEEISIIQRQRVLDAWDSETGGAPLVGAVPNYSTMTRSYWHRVPVPHQGLRSLAVGAEAIYLGAYFEDVVLAVSLERLTGGQSPEPAVWPLGPPPLDTAVHRGEAIFNDATYCYQHWQSCASCHPDGRADALNWDLLNDGVGNPKNTKSLLRSHATPPAMATGVRPDAETAVRAGMNHILFTSISDEDARALDAYLRHMPVVASPHLVAGHPSAAAERGQRIFESGEKAGCARCHPAPLFTDLRRHDVGTRASADFTDRFDTPTLIEAWRTAPYLHDGRYTSIRQLLVEGRHGNDQGRLDRLSDQEMDDLIQYVLSL